MADTQEHMFDIDIDMLRAGVEEYLAYNPAEEDPEALIARIAYIIREKAERQHTLRFRLDRRLKG